MENRLYQNQAIEETRQLYASGITKVLMHMPTGSGKTTCFCTVIKRTVANGKKCLVVVRGIKLIEQASARLTREGIEHGIYQGANTVEKLHAFVNVCSIDTLYRRRDKMEMPEADIAVIDEAHLTSGAAYKWFLEHYKNSYILAVTATPYLPNGMRHVADAVVAPVTFAELVEQGYLVAPKYIVPELLDLSDVPLKGSDYEENALAEKMKNKKLYGDVLETYKQRAVGPTLLFAVRVDHSKELAQTFNEAGISAEHVDADTPPSERNEVIKRLESGETKVVCSVGIMTTGVDIPALQTLIDVRPTLSENLNIQKIGRGSRPFPGKDHFLVIDHANNVMKHGSVMIHKPCKLDGHKKKKTTEVTDELIICNECAYVFNPFDNPANSANSANTKRVLLFDEKANKLIERFRCTECPDCGNVNSSTQERKDVADSVQVEHVRMVEYSEEHLLEFEQIIYAKELKEKRKECGYKRGWCYHRMKQRYGDQAADKHFPKRIIPPWIKRGAPKPSR